MVEQTKRAFRYDHVFGPEQSDAHIESSVKDLVTNLIQGKSETKNIHKFVMIVYCSAL